MSEEFSPDESAVQDVGEIKAEAELTDEELRQQLLDEIDQLVKRLKETAPEYEPKLVVESLI